MTVGQLPLGGNWYRTDQGVTPLDDVYYYYHGDKAATRRQPSEDTPTHAGPQPSNPSMFNEDGEYIFSEGLGNRKSKRSNKKIYVTAVTPIQQALEMARANILRKHKLSSRANTDANGGKRRKPSVKAKKAKKRRAVRKSARGRGVRNKNRRAKSGSKIRKAGVFG